MASSPIGIFDNRLLSWLVKTYQDPEFHKEYRKVANDEPTPLLPEDHERAIKEVPRERDVIETFKQVVGAGPLPPRL